MNRSMQRSDSIESDSIPNREERASGANGIESFKRKRLDWIRTNDSLDWKFGSGLNGSDSIPTMIDSHSLFFPIIFIFFRFS